MNERLAHAVRSLRPRPLLVMPRAFAKLLRRTTFVAIRSGAALGQKQGKFPDRHLVF